MKPFPSELQNTINPEGGGRHAAVEFQRHLFCNQYDDCLNEAVKKGWNSFTCVRCAVFAAATEAATQAAAAATAHGVTDGRMGIEMYATQRRLA